MANLTVDQPELMALAALSSVPVSKMANAFNEPGRFFEQGFGLTLEELARIQAACQRLSTVQTQMLESMAVFTDAARAVLEGANAD